MVPMGTNRVPMAMATATPNSFPLGVVADSSGAIGPSAPVRICSQPVGGVVAVVVVAVAVVLVGEVVACSTATTLGVTADDPRGRQSPFRRASFFVAAKFSPPSSLRCQSGYAHVHPAKSEPKTPTPMLSETPRPS